MRSQVTLYYRRPGPPRKGEMSPIAKLLGPLFLWLTVVCYYGRTPALAILLLRIYRDENLNLSFDPGVKE